MTKIDRKSKVNDGQVRPLMAQSDHDVIEEPFEETVHGGSSAETLR